MNAVEIESAISDLALLAFDAAEFPFQFLAAFGNKPTALKRLRAGNSNISDLPGGVLQRNNIHIAVCEAGQVGETLAALRSSPATAKGKVRFILATDGEWLEAEELGTGETIACDYADFPNHFGFLLPLAGISTIKEIKDNPIDVRATSRLNKLYVELLDENPEWASEERRADMNHFMARLIFCFFAEDTDIFRGEGIFTQAVDQFSERDGSNTHQVLAEIFRAMNIPMDERDTVQPRLPTWASRFPYVNGGLFSGDTEVPRFTRMARTYLVHAGNLNWKQINPDIFGSMIQAVADEEERGALGMHYTSVPNILKVLNPLFLDDLREQLEAAGQNRTKLLNLRKRMARIRVFDPACGSGNFLVIAYKQMREIEAVINERRGEANLKSQIPLTNFRGIELNNFPAEIARLALIIAEYQCDVLYRGQQDALQEFLPLSKENWIICGNALRLDWLSICPPTGTSVKVTGDDLFSAPLDQSEIDFENEGGETYICGNPPYKGSQSQSTDQKSDLEAVMRDVGRNWKTLDYVAGWLVKAVSYSENTRSAAAFVTTNSICQGRQVGALWEHILNSGNEVIFAHTSFKWSNLASHNAGVTVVIVGISNCYAGEKRLYTTGEHNELVIREVKNINPYLVPAGNIIVNARNDPLSSQAAVMSFGSMANDGGHLILTPAEARTAISEQETAKEFIRPFPGAQEFIRGETRFCIWVNPEDEYTTCKNTWMLERFKRVQAHRESSTRAATKQLASVPYRFGEVRQRGDEVVMIIPKVSSETRPYLPVGLLPVGTIISDLAFGFYDAPLWNMALIASRLHLVWIGTVCGKMKTDFRYSNTLGWNTFPVPFLTEQNKADLTACAENILLAREAHFPATIADLYDPEKMPENLRAAHEHNDEVLERIYIGRRFRNDTERLEKLFDLYTKMTAAEQAKPTTRPVTKGARRAKS